MASVHTGTQKCYYDLQKSQLALAVGSPLEVLIIENFDEEQIWQQLELQNNAVLSYFKKAVSTAQKDKDIYLAQSAEEETPDEGEGVSEEESELISESEEEQRTQEKILANTKRPKRTPVETFSDDDDDSDMDFDIDKLEKQNKQKHNNKKTMAKASETSILDDKFFKLSEMEAFLEKVEKEDGEEDDNDEVDYFEDIDSYDDDDMDEDFHITKSNKRVSCVLRKWLEKSVKRIKSFAKHLYLSLNIKIKWFEHEIFRMLWY
ncbi:U3 small nucleolar ribonucleoprotein protein MPP10-like [Xenopus laevis]|uniref:U3 small nucleolar ribonucleoprotein protein MPP10-like n=1 Tax=Xenopus laevis TaxID=8355 RepID=A0A8J1MRP2_XENLA|nr:U3 small nucleolar ribonucleoprotein protein MPP10-like [Xenopus laevis]